MIIAVIAYVYTWTISFNKQLNGICKVWLRVTRGARIDQPCDEIIFMLFGLLFQGTYTTIVIFEYRQPEKVDDDMIIAK